MRSDCITQVTKINEISDRACRAFDMIARDVFPLASHFETGGVCPFCVYRCIFFLSFRNLYIRKVDGNGQRADGAYGPQPLVRTHIFV